MNNNSINDDASTTSTTISAHPITIPAFCADCQKESGVIKVLEVTIPNEEPTIVTSFSCLECGKVDADYFDGDTGNGTGVKITCNFETAEDLQRSIRLPRLSTIKFKQDEIEIEYTTGNTAISLVEEVIRKLIDNLIGVFHLESRKFCLDDIKCKHDDCDKHENSEDIKMRLSEVGEVGEIDDDASDKDKAEKNVRFLVSLLRNHKFKMVIIDRTGIGKVAPRGKMLKDIKDENEFDDGIVKHEYYKVEDFNEQ